MEEASETSGASMSVYIIAQLKFTERERYDRYQQRFFGVFRNFKGKLLVADEHPVVLEGDWPRDKVVIMEFPNAEAARGFQESREYQEIAVDRKAGADAVVLTVRGLK
jgi:uncharacterized protein (DUF1330 family)